MAIGIGFVTVLIAVAGIFVPDWIKDQKLTSREAISILVGLAVLLLIFFILQQVDLRRAEVEHEQREMEQDAEQKRHEAREQQREEHERLREASDANRDAAMHRYLKDDLRQMERRGEQHTERYKEILEIEQAYQRTINKKKELDRVEDAIRRGEFGYGNEIVKHGRMTGDAAYSRLEVLRPIGDSIEVLRDKADAKLRSFLDRYAQNDELN